MRHSMTTTAFALEGHPVVRNIGVVRGIVVRSDAFDMMVAHAQALGANAVVAIRYDATEIMQGVSEVLCYGTAVEVEQG